ncbi:MAG: penicillin-binding protein 2 [bacterium]|nr:penicillin-binding protein 2 [bacterium]
MYQAATRYTHRIERGPNSTSRLTVVAVLLGLGCLVLAGRFFQLQVLEAKTYKLLASDQHEIQARLIPKRGTIYLQDRLDGALYPIAKDRDSWLVYAAPREIKDPHPIVDDLSGLLQLPADEIRTKISTTSSYAVLAKDVSLETVDQIRSKRFLGIGISKGTARLYPEPGIGGQVIGFISAEDQTVRQGRYGLEGAMQETLAGKGGMLVAEKDAAGRRLTIGDLQLQQAEDGSDLVLTLDRAIQYQACERIKEAVDQFQARSGSVTIMDPNTGAILAMCSAPNFDPSQYGKTKELSTFNNPSTFDQFEPGSIFKGVTLAIGLDLKKITPNTVYVDKGEETMDGFTIRNSDKAAHGAQTMNQVLEKSLNTGTIYVQRLIGKEAFADYVTRFGFGKKTGIGFQAEAKGDVSSLARPGKIFAATGSFGQGISASALQMLTAYAALGNGGNLMKPYIIQTVVRPDGTKIETKPEVIQRVIEPRTSRLISAMLVNVVEIGHGKRAGVPGYYVAGKTGTAQIPNPNGKGYLEGENIGSFAGYAPADNPKFAMIVTINRPKVEWAESSAAPVFGELAKFLLNYLKVPPERAIKSVPPPPAPAAATAATGTATP